MYPGPQGPLGDECAGEVVRCGAGVRGLSPGDRVVALSTGAFSRYVNVPAAFVVRRPPNMTAVAAAALPINWTTALYALTHCAGIRAGDRVLVHSAAGGTGMAAVQIALRAGAEVFGTAAPAKHDALRRLGVHHVMASRTTDFADEVLQLTGGRGVDVVFSSAGGDFVQRNLDALAPNGRYVEIGKLGIWSAAEVKAVRPDVAYHVVDLLALCRDDPATARALLERVIDDHAAARYPSPPVRTFPFERAGDAFRTLRQARHLGKIVVTQPARDRADGVLRLRGDRSYLITGGLRGLGPHVARRFVERGARALVLVSRNPPDAAAREEIARMEAMGARVLVATADVADAQRVDELIVQIAETMPPLGGIVHGAGVLHDAALRHQTAESFAAVLGPKIAGAWALHTRTLALPLDFFLLFSSTAAFLGSAGQSNHAAANAALDALAAARRVRGLPGMSIAWGVWGEIGAAADPRIAEHLRRNGFVACTPAEGLEALELLMTRDETYASFARMDWPLFLSKRPANAYHDRICGRASAAPARPSTPRAAAAPSRSRDVADVVHAELAAVLGAPIAPDAGFRETGMDSLTAVELRNRLQTALGCVLPKSVVFEHPTAAALTTLWRRCSWNEVPRSSSGFVGFPRREATRGTPRNSEAPEELHPMNSPKKSCWRRSMRTPPRSNAHWRNDEQRPECRHAAARAGSSGTRPAQAR